MNPNGQVVITAHRSEMGTGSRTSLPLVVAEELDVDWKTVRVEQAIGDTKYGSQNTDGSCSVRDFVEAMRQAGATARLMLERAAAQKWGVPAGEVSLRMGKVTHAASNRSAALGELVPIAATLPVPAKGDLRFKKPEEYRYIGKDVAAVDQHNIVTGKAVFGMDAKRPGMLYAAVERPPVYDSKVKTFDDSEALKVKGVQKTVQLPPFKQPHMFQQLGGVAVLADSTYAAMQGRKKLKVDWDLNPDHASFNSDRYKQELFASVHTPGKVVRNRGDFDSAFAGAARKLEADYYVPDAGARLHGAAGRGGRIAGRQSGGLVSDAESAGRSGCGRGRSRNHAEGCDLPRHAARRRLRPQIETRLRRGGGAAFESRGQAGQGGLDSRGRHPLRLLPLRRRHAHEGRPGCFRQDSIVAVPQRVPADRFHLRRRRGVWRRLRNRHGAERAAVRRTPHSRGELPGEEPCASRLDARGLPPLPRVRHPQLRR